MPIALHHRDPRRAWRTGFCGRDPKESQSNQEEYAPLPPHARIIAQQRATLSTYAHPHDRRSRVEEERERRDSNPRFTPEICVRARSVNVGTGGRLRLIDPDAAAPLGSWTMRKA